MRKKATVSVKHKQTRGTFLLSLIILESLLHIYGLFETIYRFFTPQSSFELVIPFLVNIIGLAILYGVYRWKRRAAYAILIYLGILFIPTTLVLNYLLPEGTGAGLLILTVILGSWYIALKNHWNRFN